jgi:hypothetical protein
MMFAAVHESGCGTFRTSRDVRLESGMRTKADVRYLWVHPWLRDENTSPLTQ